MQLLSAELALLFWELLLGTEEQGGGDSVLARTGFTRAQNVPYKKNLKPAEAKMTGLCEGQHPLAMPFSEAQPWPGYFVGRNFYKESRTGCANQILIGLEAPGMHRTGDVWLRFLKV